MRLLWPTAFLLSSCVLSAGRGSNDSDAGSADAAAGADASSRCPSDWWDCSFARRRRLTFDNRGQTEDLLGFPLLVALRADRIDYAAVQEDGADLRFVGADGALLPYEVERWDPGGNSWIWVRVARINGGSDGDFIWMYYGDPTAGDGQDASSVWGSEVRGVWHLGEDLASAASVGDSSMYGNTGAVQGGPAAVEGRIGGAVSFDGVDDWIQVPSSDSLDVTGDQLTLLAWIKMSALQSVDAGVIIKSDQGFGGTEYNYQLGVQSANVGNFRVRTPSGLTYLDGASGLEASRWYFLAGVYDGQSARVYIDAVEDGNEARTGDILSTAEPLLLGRRAIADDRFFAGIIDEARVEETARSADWIRAQYLSMTDAFVTFGAEELRR